MEKLEKGVYTFKPSREVRARLNGDLQAKAIEMAKQSAISAMYAKYDILKRREQREREEHPYKFQDPFC